MKQPKLGRRISELRQRNGLTQTELAEKCNLGLRTIQRIEASQGTPRGYTLKILFDVLGYEHDEFWRAVQDDTAAGKASDNRIVRTIKYFIDLFNLKTNTMKKVSVLTMFAATLIAGIIFTVNPISAQQLDRIAGWFLAGSKPGSYQTGLDGSVSRTGDSSAFLGSIVDKTDGFGTLMQSCSAEEYLGKRVKMTAWGRSKDVAEWAGMWMRVDGKGNTSLSFDNMQNRAIKGTNDWKKCEIVLDVPMESSSLNFGVLVAGTGKVWFDDISFEVVDDTVASTSMMNNGGSLNKRPVNLGFE